MKKERRRRAEGRSAASAATDRGLARADRQQDFLAEGILELLELQRRLALVAQYFEYCRTGFFRYFHAAIFEMNHVHLQRFDLKIPVVAAMWTSQRHELFPFRRFQVPRDPGLAFARVLDTVRADPDSGKI